MSDANEKFGRAIDQAQKGSVKDEPEQDLWEGSYSAKGMLGSLILASFVTMFVIVMMFVFPILRTNAILYWLILGVILLGWAYLLSIVAYRKLANHYELTTQRFMHRDGVLVRTMNRIELLDIDDVSYRQGPIELVFNVGNIIIKSSDSSHPELVLYGISDVRKVADAIDNARRTERRRRGLHIESI